MPRPPKTDRPVEKTISIPTSIVAKVNLELHSDIEGRVPHGKWSKLTSMLLQQWLDDPKRVMP